jgi:uncharacterized protein
MTLIATEAAHMTKPTPLVEPTQLPSPDQSVPRRDVAVDALRGFALFGIILVNVPFFASPIYEGPVIDGTADWIAVSALMALAIGKFFLIFSFLFGFGFATSIAADARAGRSSGPRFARRLIGLLAFGLIHAVFLFVGDILMLYAALGVLLWLSRDLRPRTLVALALLAYMIAVLAQGAALTVDDVAPVGALGRAEAAYLGSFTDAMRFRLTDDLWIGQTFILVFNGPAALSMFLLGLGLARSGQFPGSPGNRASARLGWGFLAVGLAASVASLGPLSVDYRPPEAGVPASVFAAAMLRSASAPLLAAGYAILVMRAADRSPDRLWTRLLSSAGRMTLTGYLLHSLVLSFIFGGWGLGLYGQVSAVESLGIGVATYLLLVAIFVGWRRSFRYGPDEWILRSWIDLRLKPIRNPARHLAELDNPS